MWSSPLILGFDVSNPSKAWVTDLMRNPALLKINQERAFSQTRGGKPLFLPQIEQESPIIEGPPLLSDTPRG